MIMSRFTIILFAAIAACAGALVFNQRDDYPSSPKKRVPKRGQRRKGKEHRHHQVGAHSGDEEGEAEGESATDETLSPFDVQPTDEDWPYKAGVIQWREDAPWLPKVAPGPECNSDADCPIDSEVNWRCKQTSGIKMSEKNSCRVPGKGSKGGNVTCMCVTIPCSFNKKYPKDPSKPQYLMIGDCTTNMILKRIEPMVQDLGWELTHIPGNAASANKGAHCLAGWLQNKPHMDQKPPYEMVNRSWDVITFNFGMHDIAKHAEGLTLEQYRSNLKKVTSKLVDEQKRSGTKLLWISSPPVVDAKPEDFDCSRGIIGGSWGTSAARGKACIMPMRFNSDVVAYNNVAAEVMQEANAAGANIEVVDLYKYMLDLCGGKPYQICEAFQKKYDAHFTPLGLDAVAKKYMVALRQAHADMTVRRAQTPL